GVTIPTPVTTTRSVSGRPPVRGDPPPAVSRGGKQALLLRDRLDPALRDLVAVGVGGRLLARPANDLRAVVALPLLRAARGAGGGGRVEGRGAGGGDLVDDLGDGARERPRGHERGDLVGVHPGSERGVVPETEAQDLDR